MQFFSDLGSWYWWVSVVFVGLVINLASSYLKPHMDRLLSVWSNAVRSRRAAEISRREKEVERLSKDSTVLIIAGQRLQNLQFNALSAGLVVVALLVFSLYLNISHLKFFPVSSIQGLVVISLCIFMILHIALTKKESELEDIVQEARKRFENSNGQ